MPSLIWLASLLTLSLAPSPEPAPDPLPATSNDIEPAQGFRARSWYLHVSPGILAFQLSDPELRMYAWGAAAGRHFVRGRHFAAQLGGFFEHLTWIDPTTFRSVAYTTTLHFVRVGPELRIGASGERVFGYGLARIGAEVLVSSTRVGAEGPDFDVTEAAPGFVTSLGVGIQGALGQRRRLILGAEPTVDVSVPETLWMFKARVFIGWRF